MLFNINKARGNNTVFKFFVCNVGLSFKDEDGRVRPSEVDNDELKVLIDKQYVNL